MSARARKGVTRWAVSGYELLKYCTKDLSTLAYLVDKNDNSSRKNQAIRYDCILTTEDSTKQSIYNRRYSSSSSSHPHPCSIIYYYTP